MHTLSDYHSALGLYVGTLVNFYVLKSYHNISTAINMNIQWWHDNKYTTKGHIAIKTILTCFLETSIRPSLNCFSSIWILSRHLFLSYLHIAIINNHSKHTCILLGLQYNVLGSMFYHPQHHQLLHDRPRYRPPNS